MDHLPPPEELDRISLERVRSEGAYDACRQRALHALRNNVDLRKTIEKLVADSKTMRDAPAVLDPQSKKRQFDSLRRELESRIMELCMEQYWDILTKPQYGISSRLEVEAQAALCSVYDELLPGTEPPPPAPHQQQVRPSTPPLQQLAAPQEQRQAPSRLSALPDFVLPVDEAACDFDY